MKWPEKKGVEVNCSGAEKVGGCGAAVVVVVVAAAVVAGSTVQNWNSIRLSNYSLYLKNEERAEERVSIWPNFT